MQMVRENRSRFGLNRCCRALGLSKGTWHYRNQPRPRDGLGEKVKHQLRRILREHPDYGSPRITPELSERLNRPINHKRVSRLLRENEWGLMRCLPKYNPGPVNRVLQQCRGKLDLVRGRSFGPLEMLSTDFTELLYAGGRKKAWLMAMHDPESRWVPAWAVEANRNTDMALKCWKRCKRSLSKQSVAVEGIIVHHDQDSVFKSHRWLRQLLIKDGARVSYSENGARHNPWIESLWARLKTEARSLIQEAETLHELKRVIDRRFVYHNDRRRHTALDNTPPKEYLINHKERISTRLLSQN